MTRMNQQGLLMPLADVFAVETWRQALRKHGTQMDEYEYFRAGLYNVVIGQFTDALQVKLKSHPDFPNAYQDGIGLLVIIKTLTYTYF